MPIVSIEIVANEPPVATLAGDLAHSLANVFGGPPSRTWVRLRALDHYAEGGGGPPQDVLPVFVSVLMAAPPTGVARKDQATALTKAVAISCNRPAKNVHIIYESPAAGRVAFGGDLVPTAGQ